MSHSHHMSQQFCQSGRLTTSAAASKLDLCFCRFSHIGLWLASAFYLCHVWQQDASKGDIQWSAVERWWDSSSCIVAPPCREAWSGAACPWFYQRSSWSQAVLGWVLSCDGCSPSLRISGSNVYAICVHEWCLEASSPWWHLVLGECDWEWWERWAMHLTLHRCLRRWTFLRRGLMEAIHCFRWWKKSRKMWRFPSLLTLPVSTNGENICETEKYQTAGLSYYELVFKAKTDSDCKQYLSWIKGRFGYVQGKDHPSDKMTPGKDLARFLQRIGWTGTESATSFPEDLRNRMT